MIQLNPHLGNAFHLNPDHIVSVQSQTRTNFSEDKTFRYTEVVVVTGKVYQAKESEDEVLALINSSRKEQQ